MEIERHEEELAVGTTLEEAGKLGVRKAVETHRAEELVPRDVEQAEVEHVRAGDGDSGQIEYLPDGSVSIPVFEEQIVVSKRTVVRERIVVKKEVVSEQRRIEADLRRERVEIETSGKVERAPEAPPS